MEAVKSNFSISKKDVSQLAFLLIVMACIGAVFSQVSISFNLGFIVPGLSTAAALEGLRRAYKAYKKGKDAKKILAVIFGWNVVSLIIAWAGDAALGWVLENHLETLANW